MHPNARLIFFVTALSMLVYSMQFSMVSIALPEMNADLDAPLRWTGWVLTLFMIGQIVSMPVAGRVAERFGKRTVFAGGLIVFGIASLACAVAPNIWMLIAARGLQGLAGGTLMPSGMGVIGDVFAEQRTRWIGLMGSIVPLGGVVGPSLGGVIVDHLGWRWTFALNVPMAVIAIIAFLTLVPSSVDAVKRPRRLDLPGIAMLGVGATALIFALTEFGRQDADPDPLLIALGVILSVVAITLLLRREARAEDPPIDLDLLRKREFMFANILALLFGAGVFGMFNIIPLYAQVGYGLTPTEAGALVTPRAIAMVSVSAVAAMLLPISGYRRPLIVGMASMAVVMFLLSLGLEDPTILGVGMSSFVWLTIIVAAAGIAFGSMNPSLNNASLDLAPDRIPQVAGLRGMFMSLGGSIGVTVILVVAERASTPAAGLQASFIGLSVMFLCTIALVFGIPDMQRTHAAVARPAAPPAPPSAPSGGVVGAGPAGAAAAPVAAGAADQPTTTDR